MSKIVGLAQFISDLKPPKYVLRPVLQRGYLYALTAQTNHGKTALVHYWMLRKITGRVLLLCGENPDDSRARLFALAEQLGLDLADLDKRVYVWSGAGKLLELIPHILAQANKIGDFELVIVDTAAAYFSYEDENDNVDSRQHAQDCRKLTLIRGNPAVLVPCHPAKSSTADNLLPRGGSGFNSEIDTNLTLWFDGEVATLSHIKIRGPSFEPQSFRLVPYVITGFKDEDGQPVTSVYCDPITDADEARLARTRNADEDALLQAMSGLPDGSMADWARACGWLSNGAPHKSKVARILDRLAADKLIRKYRGRPILTMRGAREAER